MAVTASVEGRPVTWEILETRLETRPGAAGLPTLRLTCELSAPANFSAPRLLSFADAYRGDRVGWHEITANGVDVRLLDSPVPVTSSSDELRTYPTDLLASPLNQRSLELRTEPGENIGSGTTVAQAAGDPFSNFIASADRTLENLIGGQLTPLVGTLAVLLAILLGAGHALLPGHGKTMIAAYLAARRGRSRDAVIVGATVTATHTAGVLLLGLAISVSSTLAGEQVLRWLGIVSGLLVAAIGVYMLQSSVRAARTGRSRLVEYLPDAQEAALVGASVGTPVGTGHGRGQETDPDPGHGHEHEHDHEHGAGHDHEHGAGHDHEHGAGHDHSHGGSRWLGGHSHEPAVGRGGLIGMGVAGGLVPSPSALIVLVASIALGRTVFGVFLVVAYGLGMAATLTVAGLLLVRLRGRLDRRAARAEQSKGRSRLAAVSAALPILTATLVLIVGLGLALRGLLLVG